MLLDKLPTITTSSGAPIADNQNSLTAGPLDTTIERSVMVSYLNLALRGNRALRCEIESGGGNPNCAHFS